MSKGDVKMGSVILTENTTPSKNKQEPRGYYAVHIQDNSDGRSEFPLLFTHNEGCRISKQLVTMPSQLLNKVWFVGHSWTMTVGNKKYHMIKLSGVAHGHPQPSIYAISPSMFSRAKNRAIRKKHLIPKKPFLRNLID